MATVSELYGPIAAATALTITLNSLASGSYADSNVIDNTTDKALDALVQVWATTASGTLGSNPNVSVYVMGSADGTNFPDAGNLRLLDSITITTAAALAAIDPTAIAQLYGGQMPPYWKIRVYNNTGLALGASGNGATYTEVQNTVA